jgi:hypothetical protein
MKVLEYDLETPPVRGSDMLIARLRRVSSKSLIRRLNLQSLFSYTRISLILGYQVKYA